MTHPPLIGDPTTGPGRPNARRGVHLVESAIVLNLFFLMIFGVFEFGRLMMMRHLVDNAARGAARWASGTDYKTLTDIKKAATDLLAKQNLNGALTGVNVQVFKTNGNGDNLGAWDNAGFGDGISVQVDADYKAMIPSFGILPKTVHLKSRSIMRNEGT